MAESLQELLKQNFTCKLSKSLKNIADIEAPVDDEVTTNQALERMTIIEKFIRSDDVIAVVSPLSVW